MEAARKRTCGNMATLIFVAELAATMLVRCTLGGAGKPLARFIITQS